MSLKFQQKDRAKKGLLPPTHIKFHSGLVMPLEKARIYEEVIQWIANEIWARGGVK